MKELPENMMQNLQDLPSLLDRLGSLSVFQPIPEYSQKLLFIDVLGENSPLVAAILECINVSAGEPGSYVDQALNCELPPSTPLNYVDVVAVLNAILGQNVVDLRGLCQFFDTLLSTSTSSTSTSSVSFFKAYYENTLYLGSKEASARAIFGMFMELVRDTLQKRHPKQKFYVDHELKVLRFSSDAAIIVRSTGLEKRMDVVFSVEYKPKVAAQLED